MQIDYNRTYYCLCRTYHCKMSVDPKEQLIADGRLFNHPIKHYGVPTVLTIDLDFAALQIISRLEEVYLNEDHIRYQYGGFTDLTTQKIRDGLTAMVNFAMGETYNRLRSVLERYGPHACMTIMNTRCPVVPDLEFPTWISSTLSCIGPCRVTDSPTDTLIVYASTAATMQTFGRAEAVQFNYGDYIQLLNVLKDIKVQTTPFDHANVTGSYFPTIEIEPTNNHFTLYGTVHSSHYENEDAVRIVLLSNPLGVTPFEKVGMTIDYCDIEDVVNAVAAAAAPPDIPAGQTADSVGRPCGVNFRVNYHGIQPAIASAGNVPAQARGVYIVGRGIQRRYQFIIARDITLNVIHQLMFYRLLPCPRCLISN
ncbi:hypothetical protein V6N13_036807 [Hibiscus sabdariffa]|uniref:Uncharacterized protein n=1 Tax=Hibiscus sabdariffa TaxID=183260 RepID=A0ABR2S595_9ROSI